MKLKQIAPPYWKNGGYRAIAELSLSLSDVERRFGLAFRSERDDLGPFEWAAAELVGFGCIIFVLYTEDVNGRLALMVDLGEPIPTAFKLVCERLRLTSADIVDGGWEN